MNGDILPGEGPLKNIFKASNQAQDQSNDRSKDGHTPNRSIGDTIFARLRRLELKQNQIDAKLSIIQRDLWRIEKKSQGQTEVVPPKETLPEQSYNAALFGGL